MSVMAMEELLKVFLILLMEALMVLLKEVLMVLTPPRLNVHKVRRVQMALLILLKVELRALQMMVLMVLLQMS